jgi:hypothetical protein
MESFLASVPNPEHALLEIWGESKNSALLAD